MDLPLRRLQIALENQDVIPENLLMDCINQEQLKTLSELVYFGRRK